MKHTHILLIFPFLFLIASCDKVFPDLERNNPNDLRNGVPRVAIAEINVLDGGGRLTTAKRGSTVYISISVINYGEVGKSLIVKNIKGIFNAENNIYIKNIVPAFGTPVSFYRDGVNLSTDLEVGQTAYAIAFPKLYSTYAFKMDVAQNAVRGEQIKFNVQLSDDANRKWNNDFKVIID